MFRLLRIVKNNKTFNITIQCHEFFDEHILLNL
jgi:hypothetical protein